MNRRLLTLLTLLLCQCLFKPCYAEDILVIINSSTQPKEIGLKQIRNIFLKKDRLSDAGVRWIPVNLNPDHTLRLSFSEKLFKQSPEEMEQYWNTQYFNGVTPPYVVASEEAMRLFVATTPGAIGYISPCNVDNNVKVAFKLVIPDTPNQNCETAKAKKNIFLLINSVK